MNSPVAIFDADGVFLRSTRPADYLERHYGLTRDKLTPFLREIGGCLLGQADMKTILPVHLERWGIGQSVDEFLGEAFSAGCGIDPDVAEIVADLRKRGVPCCLATNQDKHRMAYLDQHLSIRTHFDRTYVSCEMGTKKPDRDFYEAVGRQWPGCRLAFWDDHPENIDAARKCGWIAFVFKDVATLQNGIAAILT